MWFPILNLSAQSPHSNIDAVTNTLGIPWEKSKDIPFGPKTLFTGFLWNLDNRTVSIPAEKVRRYLSAIKTWSNSQTHSLKEVQKLYGKLLHALLVNPPGQAYLTGLETMLGIFNSSPHKPWTLPRAPAPSSNGGSPNSVPLSQGPFLALLRFTTQTPSQTPAHQLVLGSSSVGAGAPGASSWVGRVALG